MPMVRSRWGWRALFFGSAVWVGAGVAHAQGADGVIGRWLSQDGRGVISIQHCAASICGHIDWQQPRDGAPNHDAKNPDPDLRSRPFCGLTILYGFKRDPARPGAWQDGTIYDPAKGDTYTATIAVRDRDHIVLRGYILLPLLGESQVWSRADDATHPPCKPG